MRFTIQSPEHRACDESEATLRIVQAARQVFIETGGSGFSMRLVAGQAGISTGALQHFYPKREQVLAAMLEFVVNEYERAYDTVFQTLPADGEARLLGAVEYLCEDLLNQDTRAFFFALWAMSCHNELAAGIMRDMYEHHTRNFAAFIGAARPKLSQKQCVALAMQVVALIEGMMVFTAPDSGRFSKKTRPFTLVEAAVLALIEDARP
jgi:AcrR family transcriptional regulator